MPARKLNVNLDDLARAMSGSDRSDAPCMLDIRTGALVHAPGAPSAGDASRPAALPEEEGRYVPVPEMDAHETYRIMEDFIDTVRDEHIRDTLEAAIAGRSAFRRFAEALHRHPELYERWCEFETDRKRDWARAFLKDLGIVSTWRPPEESRGHAGEMRR